jgi:hypothetical protein
MGRNARESVDVGGCNGGVKSLLSLLLCVEAVTLMAVFYAP